MTYDSDIMETLLRIRSIIRGKRLEVKTTMLVQQLVTLYIRLVSVAK